MTVQPLTPPSSNSSSPRCPVSPTGDALININTDIEKQDYNHEKNEHVDRIATVVDDGLECPETPSKHGFHQRISGYLRSMSFSEKMPHVAEVWRRNRSGAQEKNVQRIDDHPMGYPQLAAFINSDPNFLMCRRFGFLHSRVLLYRQDELAQLENDLMSLDEEDAEKGSKALISRKLDEARQDCPRKALIQGIDEKLKEYDELVLRCQAFASLKKASTRNYNSFANWIHNKKPLSREESKFVKHNEDLIALADGQEGGWFDGFVEDILSLVPCKLSRLLFTSPTQRRKTDDAYVHLYSKERIDILVRLVITLLAVSLLMAPVVVLFSVQENGNIKIAVILLFTFFFSVALSVFTKAKRHEVFAATAA
ncbi:MAG: hypothetical protein M1830_008252 [Pleopsidium flavum]|nr:MAG: hypothetical protein M1830_008252 [Pleopsidium flavum]